MASSTERSLKTYARRQGEKRTADRAAVRASASKIDPVVLDFMEKCQKSPRYFIECCLSVQPMEGGEIVPFILNPGQDLVMQSVERQLAENKPVRVLCLKSRRHGISTLGEALAYWGTSNFPYKNGMVVAHKKVNTGEIFRMAKLFYDTDSRHKLNIAPEILESNAMALRFGVDRKAKAIGRTGLNSQLLLDSAEGSGVGVGLTLHVLHLSEIGKWVNEMIMPGLMVALTRAPGTIGIAESTAEGVGNTFHKMWKEAEAGRSEWDPVFLSWLLDPNNWLPVSEREAAAWSFTDRYERDLYEKHGASLNQIKWRRMKLSSPEMMRPGYAPEEIFKQEFPTTPDEAFLTSGKNFFLVENLEALAASGKGVKKPAYRARIPLEKVPADRDKRDWKALHIPPVRDDYGELYVWEEPKAGEDYVIGGDPAQGLEHGDNSVAWVLKRSTLEFVARLKSRKFDSDEFGQKCALLGWWYNTALIGIEINGPGVAANSALRRVHYNRVWYDRDIVRADEPMKQYLGWRTSTANRRSILERLEEEIRRMTVSIPAEEFFAEARTFQLIDGRPEAIVGCHDDEIMSAAIAVQIHLRGGAVRGTKATKEAAPTLDFAKPKSKENLKRKREIRSYEW
jgi:hypothetical protein